MFEFIAKIKDPAVLVTIVLACLAGGFTVGYNSNGYYIKAQEDKIKSLTEENQKLNDLQKNVSFAAFLSDLNRISKEILSYKDLEDKANSLERELGDSKNALDIEHSKNQKISEEYKSSNEKYEENIASLNAQIDDMHNQLYSSFDEPVIKKIMVGQAEVFIEPNIAVGLSGIDSAYQRAKISFGETREKEVSVGENIMTDVNGNKCFVRFMGHNRDSSYNYYGTFSVYCSKS